MYECECEYLFVSVWLCNKLVTYPACTLPLPKDSRGRLQLTTRTLSTDKGIQKMSK